MTNQTVTVSVSGSGGSGAVTAGLVLLKSAAAAGFYGHLARFYGPQIRGGESAVMASFSTQPIEGVAEIIDFHFALDWRGFERFSDEIPLSADSTVFYDSNDALPQRVSQTGANLIELKMGEQLRQAKGSRPNAFAIGVLAARIGLPREAVSKAVHQTWGVKEAESLEQNLATVMIGYGLLETEAPSMKNRQSAKAARWNISGNEACALGALRGGIKFAAAYPITPASEIVEYLAPRLEKAGGNVMIAEDELAAINMAIGGSFGGKPSMTATSGPGFSLMIEAMGLAVASETPVLVVNVMRGGPSTGIPTKSEQTDLNQALFGLHGEAPHVVVAPLTIADTVLTTQWSVGLAEALQTLVVLLSDQQLGQSRALIDAVPAKAFDLQRKTLKAGEGFRQPYRRYATTPDAVSPMAIPGDKEGRYTAEGLEHTASGKPSSMASDHKAQTEKRDHKIRRFDYGDAWAETLSVNGNARAVVLTWGSAYASAKQAVLELNEQGVPVDLLAVRLLMPLRSDAIQKVCEGRRVIVVEQSYSAQFFHYCLGQGAIASSALRFAKPGPLALKAGEIKRFVMEVLA